MILLCAATGIEARACRSGVANAKERFEILQTGMGLKRAEHALRDRLRSDTKPELIISTGFAGSWSVDFPIGSWVIGKSIALESGAKLPLQSLDFLKKTNLPSADFVSLTSPRSGHADHLVDMESFAWARVAAEFSIPFQILRLVSDNPKHPLPAAIEHFSKGSIAQGLLKMSAEPRAFTQFIARSSRLPKLLSEGWRDFA